MNGRWDGPLPDPQVRTIDEIKTVLADPGCTSDQPIYFMYRDLARTDDDRRLMKSQQIRYDITVIPPLTLCGEYVKTKGHYHTENPAGLDYPEIYEVIEGTGHYLLQTKNADDVILIQASAGDKVIIPPGYGHVTINPSKETLIMSNLVSTGFSSVYQRYEELRGGAYYEMEGGAFVKNPGYPHAPPLRYKDPVEHEEFFIQRGVPLYDLIGRPRSVAFLNHPEQFPELFEDLTGRQPVVP